jgi:AraC family transcriptional regulator
MTGRIVTRMKGALCPCPISVPQGSMKLLARDTTSGLILEEHEAPPGEVPESHPPCHAIGVWKLAAPYRLYWREKGTEKTALLGNDALGLCTAEPLSGFRWDGNIRMLALSIGIETMERALPEPFARPPIELVRLIGGDPDPVLKHLIDALRAEFVCSQPSRGLIIDNLANATAFYLAQRYGASPPQTPAYKSGLSRERLSRVSDYIEAHLDRDLSLAELSGVACLSPYHFGKMFKRSTGQSPHQYVMDRRVRRAKSLLLSRRHTLLEIALSTGFHDQSQFTTAFKRYMGITPGEFRFPA